MSVRRILAVSRAHIRELSRRKLAILMLVGLPLAFYLAAFDARFAISFATVGFGWSIAIISLFSTHSLRAIAPRLALIGFRSVEIVFGRLLSIGFYGIILGTPLFGFLQSDDVVLSSSHLATSMGFAFLGSCTAGLAVGALVDREMEAMLLLIGLVALTLVVDYQSFLAEILPMYATDRHAWASVDGMLQPDDSPWRSTVVVSAVLAAVAIIATLAKAPRVERK